MLGARKNWRGFSAFAAFWQKKSTCWEVSLYFRHLQILFLEWFLQSFSVKIPRRLSFLKKPHLSVKRSPTAFQSCNQLWPFRFLDPCRVPNKSREKNLNALQRIQFLSLILGGWGVPKSAAYSPFDEKTAPGDFSLKSREIPWSFSCLHCLGKRRWWCGFLRGGWQRRRRREESFFACLASAAAEKRRRSSTTLFFPEKVWNSPPQKILYVFLTSKRIQHTKYRYSTNKKEFFWWIQVQDPYFLGSFLAVGHGREERDSRKKGWGVKGGARDVPKSVPLERFRHEAAKKDFPSFAALFASVKNAFFYRLFSALVLNCQKEKRHQFKD